MKEILIRDVKEEDFPEIKEIIDETWEYSDLFDGERALDAALGLYFNQVLYGCSFGKAAVLDGKVIGVIFGYVNGESPKYRMMQEDNSEYILTLLNMPEGERKNINEYMSKLHYTYEKLLNGKKASYDGTLDFLILSEEARGLKIGRKLWDELAVYFKKNDVKSIYVFTDTECNFGFYEHLGFSRKGQQDVTYIFDDEPFEATIFLYDYQFDQCE